MKTIWKFPLKVADVQQVEMPLPATVLTVQPQGMDVCAWAEVDPKGVKAKVSIAIVGTGHPMPEGRLRYINTFQLSGGALVFHAYEIIHELS